MWRAATRRASRSLPPPRGRDAPAAAVLSDDRSAVFFAGGGERGREEAPLWRFGPPAATRANQAVLLQRARPWLVAAVDGGGAHAAAARVARSAGSGSRLRDGPRHERRARCPHGLAPAGPAFDFSCCAYLRVPACHVRGGERGPPRQWEAERGTCRRDGAVTCSALGASVDCGGMGGAGARSGTSTGGMPLASRRYRHCRSRTPRGAATPRGRAGMDAATPRLLQSCSIYLFT